VRCSFDLKNLCRGFNGGKENRQRFSGLSRLRKADELIELDDSSLHPVYLVNPV
jgi:hypothetical protein